MSRFAWLRNTLPIPLVIAAERFKRKIAPSAGLQRIRNAVASLGSPTSVLAGPFAGMKYTTEATGSAYFPKIVGSYESELHGIMQELLSMPLDRVIDIGTAEGYYAVGFAVKMPGVRIVGYDIDTRARYLLNELSLANGVRHRIDIRGEATTATLQSDLADANMPLVICDCEGFEGDLLDPSKTPAMTKTIVLVELHDFIRPGLNPLIRSRYESTHQIIEVSTFATGKLPSDVQLDDQYLSLLNEGRPTTQKWLYMKPR